MKSHLVKKWFHSVQKDDATKTVVWQGQILAEPQPGTYLVQLYEWMMGEPSEQKLVPFADMAHWHFYDSDAQMKETWERIRPS